MPVPLDRQVTSLTLSKRLEAAGLPTETLWAWCWRGMDHTILGLRREGDSFQLAPAYTTDELLEWLREQGVDWRLGPSTDAKLFVAWIWDTTTVEVGATPAEALGELALQVKEAK